eukprot:3973936-Amphidinium_carterae.1
MISTGTGGPLVGGASWATSYPNNPNREPTACHALNEAALGLIIMQVCFVRGIPLAPWGIQN